MKGADFIQFLRDYVEKTLSDKTASAAQIEAATTIACALLTKGLF